MKLRIDHVLISADGEKPLKNTDNNQDLTAKDVMINSILTPLYDDHGRLIEEGSKKLEKYDIWKLLVNAKRQDKKIEVSVTIDQAKIIKTAVEKFQSQLIWGQINELMEAAPEEEADKPTSNNLKTKK